MSSKLKEFEFDGVRSGSFGLWINGSGVFNAPDPDVTYTQIPGRSGDLIFNNNRFLNITVTYPGIFMPRRFIENFRAFKAFLLSHVGGYFVLKDDYQPDHFRLASVNSGLQVSDIKWGPDAGSFDLTFECMPQLWLDSGEEVQTFNASGTISNPTAFEAKPKIRVYGYGTITVGERTIIIAQNGLSYIDIDCELMNCTCEGQNANTYITAGDYFPILTPGENQITISSQTITKVEVTPRWWTL